MAVLDIMEYIDNLNPVNPKPFIGHRLWKDANKKEWYTDMLTESAILLQSINYYVNKNE